MRFHVIGLLAALVLMGSICCVLNLPALETMLTSAAATVVGVIVAVLVVSLVVVVYSTVRIAIADDREEEYLERLRDRQAAPKG